MSDQEEQRAEYEGLVHAMQTGVALMESRSEETAPKHLRVGVNAAMCDHVALVRLLIAKGVITHEEYVQAITDEMRREVKRYEDRIATRGTRITLA